MLASLYRAAWRLARNAEDAEDLVQDTCARALEHAGELDAADHPQGWLLRVLYHRFVDGARRRKRSPVVALGDDSPDTFPLAGRAPGPEELAEQSDRERALDRAWIGLEQTHRVLLSLRAEGYGLAEIEAITGISRSVLRARLHRARQSLARHLEQQDDCVDNPPRQRRSQ
jgi:RNA polymerase sigma-70 factor (ECF subfamily)